jgi:histidine triad (HIT) family protein
MSTYDPNNIFAKIIAGQIPCEKLYEDQDVIAFMDIMPQADGHCLVVPKASSRNLLDADPKNFSALFHHVQRIANATKKAMQADGITIMQFNEPAAGQTVFHLHVHIMPRHEGIPLKPHTGQMGDMAAIKAHADKIRAAL